MKYSNELKVGVAVAVATLIFIVGVRYFADVPVFGGTYALTTAFDDAGGLLAGNDVRVNGVKVGTVDNVRLDIEARQVAVKLSLDGDVVIPEGSYAEVGGFAAFGSIYIEITLGGGPPLPEGAMIPGRSTNLLGQLTDRAPELIGEVDTLLGGVGATFGEVQRLLGNPESDLRQTLAALRSAAASVSELLRTERGRISSTLASVDTLTSDLRAFTGENGDSLTQAVQNLNDALSQLDRTLSEVEEVTASLDALATKINEGEGTLGRLVNDPSLYAKLDSAATGVNRILADFEENPGRYLRELRLVDIF